MSDEPRQPPEPLEYESRKRIIPPDPPPPLAERLARIQLIVGAAMVLLGTQILDGGGLLKVSLILFGSFSLLSALAVLIRAKQERRPVARIAIWAAIFGLTCLPLSFTIHPYRAYPVRCASNMRQIGQSLLTYAQANNGCLPATLDQLVDGNLEPRALTCPGTDDTPAPGATPEQQALNLTAGGHLSYIYCGKGLRTTAHPAAETVILWEPRSNHQARGGNALFADGHVEFLNPDELADLAAGHNPPRRYGTKPVIPPTTLPARN